MSLRTSRVIRAATPSDELGFCLGWKGQCICYVTRGRGREGGREGRGGEGKEGGREGRAGWRGGREGGREGREGGWGGS